MGRSQPEHSQEKVHKPMKFLPNLANRLSILYKILIIPLLGSLWLIAAILATVSFTMTPGQPSIAALFAMVLLATVGLSVMAVGVAVTLTRPIQNLIFMTQQLSRGNLRHRAVVKSADELGLLTRHFNEMADHLEEIYQTLKSRVEELESQNRELSEKQMALVQTEKLSAISQLVANMAHELNNPLTSVVGYAELLQTLESDPRGKEYCQYIVENSLRIHRIVQNLLVFARENPPEKVWVNLNELIEATLNLRRHQLQADNIELAVDLAHNLLRTMVDPNQFQQVLLNLINNAQQAITAARKGSKITVWSQVMSGWVRISVADDGPGISPEIMPKIFDPFFTTKEVGKGVGLGLSISYGIVQQHGGRIWAESTPGQGATFHVELPIVLPPQATDSSRVSLVNTARRLQEKHILVVDDEVDVADLVARALSTEGCAVDIAFDGRAALAKLEDQPYDLIVCNLKMPGMGGLQLYDRLKNTHPGRPVRIIFVTADPLSGTIQHFLRESGAAWVQKPFNVPDLRELVGQLLESGPAYGHQLQPPVDPVAA